MPVKRLSPHQRIVRAAKRGTGVRFTAQEVDRLAEDHAIHQVATWDDMADEDRAAASRGSYTEPADED